MKTVDKTTLLNNLEHLLMDGTQLEPIRGVFSQAFGEDSSLEFATLVERLQSTDFDVDLIAPVGGVLFMVSAQLES